MGPKKLSIELEEILLKEFNEEALEEEFEAYFDLEAVKDFGLTQKDCIQFAEYLILRINQRINEK